MSNIMLTIFVSSFRVLLVLGDELVFLDRQSVTFEQYRHARRGGRVSAEAAALGAPAREGRQAASAVRAANLRKRLLAMIAPAEADASPPEGRNHHGHHDDPKRADQEPPYALGPGAAAIAASVLRSASARDIGMFQAPAEAIMRPTISSRVPRM